uniref:Uncharacterized protein n=1 Tax=Oryza punctata TaxID=4537 RepID=A0A0E0LCZ5_ORYPU
MEQNGLITTYNQEVQVVGLLFGVIFFLGDLLGCQLGPAKLAGWEVQSINSTLFLSHVGDDGIRKLPSARRGTATAPVAGEWNGAAVS